MDRIQTKIESPRAMVSISGDEEIVIDDIPAIFRDFPCCDDSDPIKIIDFLLRFF